VSLRSAIAADVAVGVGARLGLGCSVALACLVLSLGSLSSEAFAGRSCVVGRECGRSLVVCPDSPRNGSNNFGRLSILALNGDHACVILNGDFATTFPLLSLTLFSDLIDCSAWRIGVVGLGEAAEVCVETALSNLRLIGLGSTYWSGLFIRKLGRLVSLWRG
jgi:hypothetical protein